MRTQDRATARRRLDDRLNALRRVNFVRPPRGWIKAIREALGMTTRQLASRIGVVQSRAVDIEKAEASGSITLDSLERAARALNCELAYVLIPRKPLKEMIEERAISLAKSDVKAARHSMALEDQSVDHAAECEQLTQLVKQITERAGSRLWEDE